MFTTRPTMARGSLPVWAASRKGKLRFESPGPPLGQRCRLGGRVFFDHLIVDLFGLSWLLLRRVESGEFKLRRHLADDNGRLVDQPLIKLDRLRVLVLGAINRSQRELAERSEVGG